MFMSILRDSLPLRWTLSRRKPGSQPTGSLVFIQGTEHTLLKSRKAQRYGNTVWRFSRSELGRNFGGAVVVSRLHRVQLN